MDLRLDNEHALVGGSTRGIGKAIAMELASNGARVTLLARDKDAAEIVVKELPPPAKGQHGMVICDMTDTSGLAKAIKALIDNNGPVSILVNNTGGPPAGPAHKAQISQFEQAFRLHLLAFQTMVQAVLPGMRASGHGRIINVISTSVKQPLNDLGVSNTIRGAVANWAKTLANELGPDSITVNNVLPGATSTERLTEIIRNKADKTGSTTEKASASMQAQVPLGRFAAPEEIAYAVAFLASPSAAYINGINLPVDGGRTACL